MKDKIELYKESLDIRRHESGDRWYAPVGSYNWKPSVTTIIGGTLNKGKGFEQWLGNHPSYKIACEERDKAADRGTLVHDLAEKYMHGESVETEDEEICKHLMSFEKFWRDNEIQMIDTELFMWHKDVPWAGTCDIIAKMNGKYAIIDIKTGGYYKSHEIQLNMYAELLSKITGEEQKNTFHCWWQWEGNKIIATQCYFDTSDIEAETALYQEQNSSNN